MRAVMEALAARGAQTVPDIARDRGVSRQHIQTIMNALQGDGLVAADENPAHKRSPLFDLTPEGRGLFDRVRANEGEPLRRLAAQLPDDGIALARATLARLNEALDRMLVKGDTDGNA